MAKRRRGFSPRQDKDPDHAQGPSDRSCPPAPDRRPRRLRQRYLQRLFGQARARCTGAFGEATLVNAGGARIGRAVLTQGATGLLIRIEAEGLPPGWHGVHIHATGQCETPFTTAGAHVNHGDPQAPHGLLNAGGPDDGDLPNIFADAGGRVNAEVFTTRARIASEGPGQWLWDSDGSSLVIHANADDHTSQPIGGAGPRIACGVMAAG